VSVDALLTLLANPAVVQRDKLAALQPLAQVMRELPDDDRSRVVRELQKRLNSPKLAGAVAQLIDHVLAGRPLAPPVQPASPEPEPPPAPLGGDAAALEAAIAAAPDVRDSYVVYGDLLEARGDPRGTLIAIGRELAKNPHHRAMLSSFRDHLAAHAAAIMGPLAGCEDLVTDVEWFMGFIKKCRVATTNERFNGKGPEVKIHDVVAWLLAGPAKFLQHLTVGIVDFEDNGYAEVCRAIAARPRPSLRTLFLGDFTSDETELNWSTIGDIGFLWTAIPNLTELTLRSGRMTVGPIALPNLRKLTTITGGLDAASLGHIANADWPALETLSLQVGLAREGATTDVALVQPFLDGTRCPALQSLGILNCEFTDELCARLPEAKILPRLRELDLSMGTMTDRGAQMLAQHGAHLERLIVEDNYLTEAGIAALQPLAKELIAGSQRVADRGRYYASAFE